MTKSRSRVSVRWLTWPTAAARPGNSALGLGSASPRMAKRSTGSAALVRAGARAALASSRQVGNRVRSFMLVPCSSGSTVFWLGRSSSLIAARSARRSRRCSWEGRAPARPIGAGYRAGSTADHLALVMGNDHGGGARSAVAVAGGVADAGVLDVDPQGAVVGCPGDAGDFAAPRADQEAAYFPGLRIGAEQLVATGVDGVGGFVVRVGLDPQAAGTIEGQAVWRGEDVTL